MRTTHLTLGRLHCHWVADEARTPMLLVMLCHGFGAPGDDLVSLASSLQRELGALASKVAFVFPEAPLDLGPMGMPGRAWWPIDLNRHLNPRTAAAGLQKMRETAPEGASHARKLLRETLAQALQHAKLPYDRLVMGGFSQGAMITTDLALRLEEAPAALAILSGTIIDETQWQRRAPMRHGLPVVQSHGTQDPILPYQTAKDLRELLQKAGLNVDWGAFDGGHTIEQGALTRLSARIRLLLSDV